jgi:hypothetical protein
LTWSEARSRGYPRLKYSFVSRCYGVLLPARYETRSHLNSLLSRYWRGHGDLACTWTSAVRLPRGSYLDPELKSCRLLLSGPLSLPVRSEIFSCSGRSNQAQTSLSYVLALPSAARPHHRRSDARAAWYTRRETSRRRGYEPFQAAFHEIYKLPRRGAWYRCGLEIESFRREMGPGCWSYRQSLGSC